MRIGHIIEIVNVYEKNKYRNDLHDPFKTIINYLTEQRFCQFREQLKYNPFIVHYYTHISHPMDKFSSTMRPTSISSSYHKLSTNYFDYVARMIFSKQKNKYGIIFSPLNHKKNSNGNNNSINRNRNKNSKSNSNKNSSDGGFIFDFGESKSKNQPCNKKKSNNSNKDSLWNDITDWGLNDNSSGWEPDKPSNSKDKNEWDSNWSSDWS